MDIRTVYILECFPTDSSRMDPTKIQNLFYFPHSHSGVAEIIAPNRGSGNDVLKLFKKQPKNCRNIYYVILTYRNWTLNTFGLFKITLNVIKHILDPNLTPTFVTIWDPAIVLFSEVFNDVTSWAPIGCNNFCLPMVLCYIAGTIGPTGLPIKICRVPPGKGKFD